MTGQEIVMQARNASEQFGKCGKFCGAATVEIVKRGLAEEGIPTSARDVFIKGVPVEIDLLIPRRGAEPSLGGILYESPQVAVALEIKKSGPYGEKSLAAVRDNFKLLGAQGVSCAYVTLEERQSYRYKATPENLGVPWCFTLHWHQSELEPFAVTEDWGRFLTFLRESLSAA
jgi:hypothetical protein